MEEKYLQTLLVFKNGEVSLLPKPIADTVINAKKKIDIVLQEWEYDFVYTLSIINASSYLKYRFYEIIHKGNEKTI